MSSTTLRALMARRQKLQDAYDAMITEPESFSINGSVSATNRKLETLRKEIEVIDRQIAAAAGSDGIERSYPNYRKP